MGSDMRPGRRAGFHDDLKCQIASTLIHSEKFKMNRNGNSILSENICDLLLVGNTSTLLSRN